MSAKTIVLAEDDPKLRRLYTDFLGANGFNVMAASDGLKTLSLLHRVQPRLVLLDIIMPELNGIETCRRARSLIDPKTPIVFLSSLDYAEHVREGLEAGGDDYIIKTSRLEVVLERINYWTSPLIRKKSERRRNRALEEIRAVVNSQDPVIGVSSSVTPPDRRASDLSLFLERAIAAAGSNFGNTSEQRLYFIGYVAGAVDFELGSKGRLQPQFMKYMRGALHSGGVMNSAQVEETMNALGKLTTSQPVKNGWEHGRRDKGADDAAGPGFVPNGLAELRSVA